MTKWSSKLKIAFMGTPDFAAKALSALLDSGYEISCVYTRAPKIAGRGQKLVTSSVYDLATRKGIAIETPKSFRKYKDEQDSFLAKGFDLVIVAAYGLILPKAMIEAPPYGCINIHGSLLPALRGAAPIQRAISSGVSETGITIMQMDENLDSGDILLQERLPIHSTTIFRELYEDLGNLGARMIITTLQLLEQGVLTKIKQDHSIATYASLLKKEEGLLDFNKTVEELDCIVRAFNPFPTTYIDYNTEHIKILKVLPIPMDCISKKLFNTFSKATIGDIIIENSPKSLYIVARNGLLRILELQRPSKKCLSAEDFLRGFTFLDAYHV